MAVTNNINGAPTAPPAPPAPGIKSIVGSGNQNQTTGDSLTQQAKVDPVTVENKPKSQQDIFKSYLENRMKGYETQPVNNSGKETSTQAPAPNVPVKKPSVNFQETPDPRDSTYWQNVQAIEATLGPMGTEMIALQGEQDRANYSYNDDVFRQNEYNRRRVRDLAEARFGTGSGYTGSARRAQAENAFDFTADLGRRAEDKKNADAARELTKQDIGNRYQASLRAEEAAGAKRVFDYLTQQAEESKGDPTGPTPMPDKNAKIKRQIKGTTQRIQVLRDRLEKANSDGQRKRIEKKIQGLRKRRSNLQGKISGKK